MDVWRKLHPTDRQYTWVKITDGNVRAARLHRIYINQIYNNRLVNAIISPVLGSSSRFSDHHILLADFSLIRCQRCPYWTFNLRLIRDRTFCQRFSDYWQYWRDRKNDFYSLIQWWEVGKTQIRIFCQQYQSHKTAIEKDHLEELEKGIEAFENGAISGELHNSRAWEGGRKALRSFLH